MTEKRTRKEPAPIKTYTKIELARIYEVAVSTLGKEVIMLNIKGLTRKEWSKRNRIYPRWIKKIFDDNTGLGHPEIDVEE